jgi:hypothetical protein
MPQSPLYTSRGDAAGMFVDGYLYNMQGEWIGWTDSQGQVFTVSGEYVGWLNKDFRVLRKRVIDFTIPRRTPPARPPKFKVPPSLPLAPMLAEINHDTIDVLDEMPDRLHTLDADPSAKDID